MTRLLRSSTLFSALSLFLYLWITLLSMLYSKGGFAYSPYSTDELDQLEKEFVEQINQSNGVLREPMANQYLNHLAKQLAYHGDIAEPSFFIVRSSEINAFAGPGGHIGVNSQLILVTSTESELAAVMAHEMAHVRQHHLYRMLEHQKQMRIPMLASLLASMALGAVNPSLGSGAMMASMTGFAQDNINYVRSNEKEADRIGIDMLIKSGLNPQGMAAFFKKMQENARYYYTANIPAILRTHPLDEDRIAEAENRSIHLRQKNYPDTLDYHLFKELIRNLVAADPKQLLDYYHSQCYKNNPIDACRYGEVLTLININQYQQAETRLKPLIEASPNTLFYAIAMSKAAIGEGKYNTAIQCLEELQANDPTNYALLLAYTEALLAANRPDKASLILLKGTRQFKRDLPLCEALARAEAANHRKDYAYFTEAECQLLQGRKKEALQRLKLAQTLAKHDHLLRERIAAKIDDIKFLLEP